MTVSERQSSKVRRVSLENGIPSKYVKASTLSKYSRLRPWRSISSTVKRSLLGFVKYAVYSGLQTT